MNEEILDLAYELNRKIKNSSYGLGFHEEDINRFKQVFNFLLNHGSIIKTETEKTTTKKGDIIYFKNTGNQLPKRKFHDKPLDSIQNTLGTKIKLIVSQRPHINFSKGWKSKKIFIDYVETELIVRIYKNNKISNFYFKYKDNRWYRFKPFIFYFDEISNEKYFFTKDKNTIDRELKLKKIFKK